MPPKSNNRSASVSRLASATASSRARDEETKMASTNAAGIKRSRNAENVLPEDTKSKASKSSRRAADVSVSAKPAQAAAEATESASSAQPVAAAASSSSSSHSMAHLNTLESKLSMVVEGVLLPVDMPLDIMGKAKRAITEQLLDVRYKNVDGMKKLLVKKEGLLLAMEKLLNEGLIQEGVSNALSQEKLQLVKLQKQLEERTADMESKAEMAEDRDAELRRLAAAQASLSKQHNTALEHINATHEATMESTKNAHAQQLEAAAVAAAAAAEKRVAAAKALARREAEEAHETALARIQAENAAAIAELRTQADAALTAASTRHTASLTERQREHEAAVAALKEEGAEAARRAAVLARSTQAAAEEAAAAAATAAARAIAAQSAEEMHGRFRAEIADAEAAHASAVAALNASHTAALAAVEATLERERQSTLTVREELQSLRSASTATTSSLRSALDSSEAAFAATSSTLEAKSSELSEAQACIAALQRRLVAVEDARLVLQESILSLKGAIRVFVRVRPALPHELAEEAPAYGALPNLFQFPNATEDATILELLDKPGAGVGGYGIGEAKRYPFAFQRVFPPTAGQEAVFHEAEVLVQSTLGGQKVCIFAYGQTGAGKTHTMMGGDDAVDRGLIPRSIDSIFEKISALAGKGWVTTATVEMVEIYNETLRDLLALSSGGSVGAAASSAADGDRLDIRHDKDGNMSVVGLSLHTVTTPSEVAALLERAAAVRVTGATGSNSMSSRSHSVFTLRLALVHPASAQTRRGVLNLIDLAGSERIAKSGVNDSKAGGSAKLLKETQCINSSLSALSNTIRALQDRAPHVPYRDSKLTYLLQNSLNSTSRTLVIANVNPLHSNSHESLCTLRFAEAVAQVRK